MTGVKLVVADVDGTLVTSDKRLPEENQKAVAELAAEGIGFTITSSRPPIGIRMLIEPLNLRLPIGTFNGAMMVDPLLNVLERHLVPEAAAQRTLEILSDFEVEPWLSTADRWIARTLDAPRIALEKRTIQADPVIMSDFGPVLVHLGKIVGVSDDYDRLDACEVAMRAALASTASVTRSQRYYLDITAPNVDKGTFVAALSRRLGIPKSAIASIGDMPNDLPMFRNSGLAIAMGNADERVKQVAQYVTGPNDAAGFADAIRRWVLSRADVTP